jgi:uncharacterized membrane protein YccF (DUF307 family)
MKGIGALFTVVLNLLWLLVAGLWMSIGYVIGGVLLCFTIIGIPFGLQAFRFAAFALWPFGKAIVDRETGPFTSIFNVVWAVIAGVWIAIGYIAAGVVLCLTLVGVPFGIIAFKLAAVSIMPLGKSIVPAHEAPEGARTFRTR